MHDTMPQAPPTEARSLHEICEDARRVNCGHCWTGPAEECTYKTDPYVRGYHVARFGRAMRRGLISGADFGAVTDAAVAFTSATVIYDAPDGAR